MKSSPAGFRPLPMLYTQRHLRDAIRPKSSYDPHRHGLTVEQMKRLPELMEHPVMLCDSPARDDTMLVVLRDVDCDDLPLIMAVRPDGRGYYEAGEIETNFILAVYGRTNFPRYFDNLITPDRVVYYDEERGRELNALAKLHLLRSHIVEPDLNKTIIRRPQCIVKSETAKVSEDAVVAIQSAGFELRGEFHSGQILQRLRGDVLDAIQGVLCLGRVRVLPPIEHAALAGDAAEGCAVPKDGQLLSLQRQGSNARTVQGNTDFFKVAELPACVLGVHVSDPPVVKK